ncbi:Sulfate permease 2, partial [Penicillium riverlandense]|uniref:Sulfate permease 2 n=1 Tax=Penicillium riverlandense TaxID=1903569 RepID=UPI00254941CE
APGKMGEKMSTKIGHTLAKGLGIKLAAYEDAATDPVTRGESAFSVGTVDTSPYQELEPSTGEWIREHTPSFSDVGLYFYNLFPFTRWIGRYNTQWLIGDLIAGITVGGVVIPQGMSYAKLANLPVEFGLYTSFMGVLIYWFFATSKDITIGPVAVMSTLTGEVITNVQKQIPDASPIIIAQALAIIAGGIVCFLGLARLGILIDFIPLPAISSFMTGAALNIASGQVAKLLGETADFSTHGPTYQIIIDSLRYLPTSQVDAAMGLTALAMLYAIRSACNYGARKHPHRAKLFFFLSTLRVVFVILFYTMISAAVNLHRKDNPAFSVLGTVPRGFQDAGVPQMDPKIIRAFVPQLPAAVIVLLIEHIAISKSFGRVNNYTINPSQELVAIGVSNLLGPFLGAYPATGSFSRTAIKSKAGVRTPFAGVITAIVVLLAIYALPPLFFYIPQASLSGVIIHAVGDLITSPNTVYQFWRVSPIDCIIFWIGVLVTTFTSIEIGIYCTICVSLAVFLFRTARAHGHFLGRVSIHSVVGDHLVTSDEKSMGLQTPPTPPDDKDYQRSIFLPMNHVDGSNPEVEVKQPFPGVFIYRFTEGFNYPNANHYTDSLVQTIFQTTRRTNQQAYLKPGDQPWNEQFPVVGENGVARDAHLPLLQAVILDFSSVNNVDITSVQNLIDVRNQLDRWASPRTVQWHFAHISNRWTKRALSAAGFGYPSPTSTDGFHRWKPIFSVAEIEGNSSAAAHAEISTNQRQSKVSDLEANTKTVVSASGVEEWSDGSGNGHESKLSDDISVSNVRSRKAAIVHGMNRPFFHSDLTSALQSAVANITEASSKD